MLELQKLLPDLQQLELECTDPASRLQLDMVKPGYAISASLWSAWSSCRPAAPTVATIMTTTTTNTPPPAKVIDTDSCDERIAAFGDDVMQRIFTAESDCGVDF